MLRYKKYFRMYLTYIINQTYDYGILCYILQLLNKLERMTSQLQRSNSYTDQNIRLDDKQDTENKVMYKLIINFPFQTLITIIRKKLTQ